MSLPSVAIIIVNWNSYTFTAACIRSIQEQKEYYMDIIVVDNGSTDQSSCLLQKEFPGIHLIEAKANLGFSGGNNLGIRYALAQQYKYCFLLNNDTLLNPNCLIQLCNFMEANTHIAAVQPKIYFQHQPQKLWNGGNGFSTIWGYTYSNGYNQLDHPKYNKEKAQPWITGCALWIRSEVIKQVGFLNEDYFIYYEDVEWSFRIRKEGFVLWYYPHASLRHVAGASGKTTTSAEGVLRPEVHYYNIRNRIWLLKKYVLWYQAPTWFMYNFLYLSVVLLYFVFKQRWAKAKIVLKAVRDAFKN